MTKPPRCSPLIAAAFAAVPRAAWSDGTPLFAVPVGATLYAAGMLAPTRPARTLRAPRRPPAPKPAPAADAVRGPRIHALRVAGACWAAVRAALGGSPTKEYLRWCAATATPPVPDRAVRDAARRARMAAVVAREAQR